MLSMAAGKRKTTLRTIRITKELDDALQEDAKAEGLALNALLSAILARHVEFERFAEKYRVLSVSRELFRAVLNSTGDSLEREVGEVTSYLPKDIISFRSLKPNFEEFARGVETTFKYSRLAECEIRRSSEDRFKISLHHDLGEKWSRVLAMFVTEIVRAALGVDPKIESTKSSVTATVSSPGAFAGTSQRTH